MLLQVNTPFDTNACLWQVLTLLLDYCPRGSVLVKNDFGTSENDTGVSEIKPIECNSWFARVRYQLNPECAEELNDC